VRVSSTSSPSSFRAVQKIALPFSGQSATGLVHTIVVDSAGYLYYSDEVNHSVVSLDDGGRIRWQRTQHGKLPGQFHYPRGLALGWIEKEGQPLSCLAVSDAWNRRVQFLDLAGNPLAAWTQAGQTPFEEVSDVRFMAGEFRHDRNTKYRGFWLILDKGVHRLSGVGPDGRLLFQIGRGFPPTLEERWAVSPLHFESVSGHSALPRNPPVFDFIFYPERILGGSEGALYLWEPFSRRLKQVLFQNLFPIRIGHEDAMEWFAADSLGLLGWHRPTRLLARYDCRLDLWDRVEIRGEPIPSNLRTNEFWVRDQNYLERWQWSAPEPESLPPAELFLPLMQTSMAELQLVDAGRIQRAIADLVRVFDEGLALVEDVLRLGRGNPHPGQIQEASEQLRMHPQKRGQPVQDLHEALHHWCLGMLEYDCIRTDADGLPPRILDARKLWHACARPIRDRYALLLSHFDELNRMIENPPDAMASDPVYAEAWKQAALAAELDLQRVAEWVCTWTGVS
jgi:hypothetical protein